MRRGDVQHLRRARRRAQLAQHPPPRSRVAGGRRLPHPWAGMRPDPLPEPVAEPVCEARPPPVAGPQPLGERLPALPARPHPQSPGQVGLQAGGQHPAQPPHRLGLVDRRARNREPLQQPLGHQEAGHTRRVRPVQAAQPVEAVGQTAQITGPGQARLQSSVQPPQPARTRLRTAQPLQHPQLRPVRQPPHPACVGGEHPPHPPAHHHPPPAPRNRSPGRPRGGSTSGGRGGNADRRNGCRRGGGRGWGQAGFHKAKQYGSPL